MLPACPMSCAAQAELLLSRLMSELFSAPIVEVEDLTKAFNGTTAVNHLSFNVPRGQILGLLGANGAGKTTAIQMLLGLVKPTSGVIRIFGRDMEQHRIEILQRCNFSSAYTSLPGNLRVFENLNVFSRLYQVADAQRKIDSLLEMFEIPHLKRALTGQLSSGESTRLNLCKALLNDPELLLLDEPTASLDPDIADKVRKLLKRIQSERNITMIYTSHNMRDVEEICDRIIFLQKGRKIADGTTKQVLAQFQQKSLEDVFIHVSRSGELLSEEEVKERK
jgi:ABC-2 type transport system ATP-binding protein